MVKEKTLNIKENCSFIIKLTQDKNKLEESASSYVETLVNLSNVLKKIMTKEIH